MTTTQQQLQHLYWRAGFGPRPADVAAGLSPRKALKQLFHDSAAPELLTLALPRPAEAAMPPAPDPSMALGTKKGLTA